MDVINPEYVRRYPGVVDRFLVRSGCRVLVRFEEQLDVSRTFGRDDGQPAVVAS
jgi:hypothetical protein